MKFKHLFISLLFLLLPILASADGGMIYWPPDVELSQQAQNAIVGWNGNQEVLILSNNIESNGSSTALRIVPLPSEPEVEQGSFESFEKMQQILNEKYAQMREAGPEVGLGKRAKQGVEITFEKKIGAHDLTVVKVDDVNSFVEWIEDFTQRENLSDKETSKEFKAAVDNYLKRGIDYFVFDVITVKTEKSVRPLVYEFDSDSLYYPLLMTAASELSASDTEVNLFTVTGGSTELAPNYNWSGYSPSVEFTQQETSQVSEKIAGLFPEKTKVKKISINRSLSQIDKDFSFYSYSWNENLSMGDQGKQVKTLQKVLINEGVWNSDVEATGYFGPITKRAVERYQEKYKGSILQPIGLSKGTGFFGPQTRTYLRRYSVKRVERKQGKENKLGACQGTTFDRSLRRGMEGEDVKCLQVMLNWKLEKSIAESGSGSPGNETDYFGPLTRAGVKRFQEKYKQDILAPWNLSRGTGFVGRTTREKLNEFLKSKGQSDQGQDREQLTYCETDLDCTLVNENCCGCENGGGKKCINEEHEESWKSELNCEEKENIVCPMTNAYLCDSLPSGCECVDNTCRTSQ